VDEHGFVCESCKLNYRKYGDENGEKIPEYLFRPVEPASFRRQPPPLVPSTKEEVKEGKCGSFPPPVPAAPPRSP